MSDLDAALLESSVFHTVVATTHPPKILPGVDSTFVSVVPLEPQRILAYRRHLQRFRWSLIHFQQCLIFWLQFSGQPPSFLPFFVASSARTCISQPHKIPDAFVPILPLDFDACSLGLLHPYFVRCYRTRGHLFVLGVFLPCLFSANNTNSLMAHSVISLCSPTVVTTSLNSFILNPLI